MSNTFFINYGSYGTPSDPYGVPSKGEDDKAACKPIQLSPLLGSEHPCFILCLSVPSENSKLRQSYVAHFITPICILSFCHNYNLMGYKSQPHTIHTQKQSLLCLVKGNILDIVLALN